jgi:hypothetical protein
VTEENNFLNPKANWQKHNAKKWKNVSFMVISVARGRFHGHYSQ